MNYFNKEINEVEKELETDTDIGLKSDEINKKIEQYGFNELEEKKKDSLLIKFLKQFKDFMIIILIIAAIVSAVVGIREGEGFTHIGSPPSPEVPAPLSVPPHTR